ncbi:metal-dependent hydrolase [Bacillus sp. SIMBA_074]|uniref:metal-dependent hydrolase n=1 Tax=Bacillus sp. SIMBA_074 TaxID=3085812 RepID=UPI00397A3EB5
MQYRTHLTTSMVIALPVLAATDTLTIANIAAVGLGALLPDIDEPHSWMGRRTRGVSDLIHGVFGHRGITHSLLGVALVLIPILFAVKMTPLSFITGMCVLAGYCLHLIEDSFSISGVKWLLPLSNKKFQSGLHIIYYRTGGMAEFGILVVSMFILIIEIRSFGASLHLPEVNVMNSLFEKIKGFIH